MVFARMLAFALIAIVAYCLVTPQLSFDSPEALMLAVALTLGYGALRGWARPKPAYRARSTEPLKAGAIPVARRVVTKIWSQRIWIVAALLVTGLLVQVGVSLPALRDADYRQLMGAVRAQALPGSLPLLEATKAPLVSHAMALRSAERKLSEAPAIAARAKLGSIRKQRVGGELFWVAFLEHRSPLDWLEQGVTPGYIKVSATDPARVELVTKLRGQSLRMRYLQSAFFMDDVGRKMWLSGYSRDGLDEFSPELDDAGNPFLAVTVFDRKVGVAGREAKGVALVDVQTGAAKYYPLGAVPAWVDHVHPESFVKEQLQSLLAPRSSASGAPQEALTLRGDLGLVYRDDGTSHFYAGLTPIGGDGALAGFILVNTRTKAATRVDLSGALPETAQSAAEQALPEKQYAAADALAFVTASGVPVYAMALQDSTGLAQAHAVVGMADSRRVGAADTLQAALRGFQAAPVLEDKAPVPSAETDFEARVLRIGSDVQQGVSVYVLVLEEHPGRLFSIEGNRSNELAVTRPGDLVAVTTEQGAQPVQPLLSFQNQSLRAAPAANTAPATEAQPKAKRSAPKNQ